MSRSAANAIMSRKMSASGAFSTSVRRFIISSVIGGSSVAFAIRNPNPNRRIANGRRKPLARYGAMGSALRERLAPSLLHHQPGHDRRARPRRGGYPTHQLVRAPCPEVLPGLDLRGPRTANGRAEPRLG